MIKHEFFLLKFVFCKSESYTLKNLEISDCYWWGINAIIIDRTDLHITRTFKKLKSILTEKGIQINEWEG